ncbi:Na+/H+ antiporter NhaD-like permease [Syntrophobacter sp. SbD1]|nr:Na+/H+ antiporter NhaD-like permease [Syntrophobacter sp. SbD1]
MDAVVLAVFAGVYAGMMLGGIPWSALDRAGVALLGAIALVATHKISPEAAWEAVNVPTISLLFGFMVVSSQLRLSGFYTRLGHRLASLQVSPRTLLALLVGVVGLLSAVLANDIVCCLAMTPVLIEGCARRGLDPIPYLLGLACAANVGSAATLIGNPQNMLIGQALHVPFTGYLLLASPPVIAGLIAVWLVISYCSAGKWTRPVPVPKVSENHFNTWQAGKGLGVVTLLVLAFLFTSWPQDVLALCAAGALLSSRRMASHDLLRLVDWEILVLFIGLFIVNHVIETSGLLSVFFGILQDLGIHLKSLPWLFGVTVLLSNLVSNVPAVMLLLPVATHSTAGPALALASTLAGNLLLFGSIANIIVAEQASKLDVHISWKMHARIGVPVTLSTLAMAAGWLWLLH